MKYTVIICTFNRAQFLSKALNSLLSQTFRKDDFSVIVVDNNSTDETPQIVDSFSKNNLKVKYVFEKRQGIAFARNRGAQEVTTDYFLYLDDDAVATPPWLANFDNFNTKTQGEYDCVTGLVSLSWEGNSRPSWFPDKYEPLLSSYNLGPEFIELTENNYLLTLNVAFKSESFFAVKGFREDLGRVGSSLFSGEDVDLLHRLLRAGYRAAYLPSMQAVHFVDKSRQKRYWLLRRLFWDGATQPYLDYGSNPSNINEIQRHFFYDIKILVYLLLTSPFMSDNRWVLFQRTGRLISEGKIMSKYLLKKINSE
jgi:glucosyl-dolichyl phosphate glucuronosyltransferase